MKAFGTAGVRGVFNKTQTPRQVYGLAETIAFATGRGAYGVGWDGRKTSALLARAVASAISAVGSDAHLFGLVPTPVLAFATRSRSCRAGFAVTASHNPAEFSGVKVFNRKGMELSGPEEEIIERALGVEFMRASGKFGQFVHDELAIQDYIESLLQRHALAAHPLKIAVDCANGPGALVTPHVLRALGHVVKPVNAQVSWSFPARPPEPTRGNLAGFCDLVRGLDVDFGLAHDGDADRLVIVDRAGTMVPDSVLSVLVLRGIRKTKGTAVVSENTSNLVVDEARRLGLDVSRAKVGKTFAKLEAEGGVFATEPSKIVDPDWGLWEDGINAAAVVSGLLASEDGLLDRIMEGLPWRYQQVNLDVRVRMLPLIERARSEFGRFKITEERTLDGYKLVFRDGSWVMFRPSGTEPRTRLYCESRDLQQLESLVRLGTECIESSL